MGYGEGLIVKQKSSAENIWAKAVSVTDAYMYGGGEAQGEKKLRGECSTGEPESDEVERKSRSEERSGALQEEGFLDSSCKWMDGA